MKSYTLNVRYACFNILFAIFPNLKLRSEKMFY